MPPLPLWHDNSVPTAEKENVRAGCPALAQGAVLASWHSEHEQLFQYERQAVLVLRNGTGIGKCSCFPAKPANLVKNV